MTESEAIKQFKDRLDISDYRESIPEYYEAMELAIKALEKQIPKKPNKAIDSSWGIKKEVHICPECDCFLTEVHFYTETKIEPNKQITYCDNCGQAIDWND